MLKDVKGLTENMKELMDSIKPGLNAAQAEYVMVHLLEHNGKIKAKQDFAIDDDTVTVDIADMVICNKTSFTFNGFKYKFRAPHIGEMFSSKCDILDTCLVSTDDPEFTRFGEMPAFIMDWADDIVATVKLETTKGTIYGAADIIGKIQ